MWQRNCKATVTYQKSKRLDANLKQRIEYAENWIRDFEEIKETDVTLTAEEKKAITELITKLED